MLTRKVRIINRMTINGKDYPAGTVFQAVAGRIFHCRVLADGVWVDIDIDYVSVVS